MVTIQELLLTYSTTLDSGIDVGGTMNLTTRDCQVIKQGNCNVVNFNFVNFSGGFGTISIGERFAAGAAMLSRLTASGQQLNQMVDKLGAFFTLVMVLMHMVLLTKLTMLTIQ